MLCRKSRRQPHLPFMRCGSDREPAVRSPIVRRPVIEDVMQILSRLPCERLCWFEQKRHHTRRFSQLGGKLQFQQGNLIDQPNISMGNQSLCCDNMSLVLSCKSHPPSFTAAPRTWIRVRTSRCRNSRSSVSSDVGKSSLLNVLAGEIQRVWPAFRPSPASLN